jgi:hypothetical protein
VPFISGGGSSGTQTIVKRYATKAVDGITVTSLTLASFSTPWTVTGVIVAAGQNILITLNAALINSTTNDYLVAVFRGATQIATAFHGNFGANFANVPVQLTWLDQNPGAATYT